MFSRATLSLGRFVPRTTIPKRDFHVSAAVSAKKHPNQVRKENLVKRAARLAEFERIKPSPIISQSTPFFQELHTPASAYGSNTDYQHFIKNENNELFESLSQNSKDQQYLGAVEGREEAMKYESAKFETLQKIVGLQNGNAKAVQLWNIQKAVKWFGLKEGDTGSPEVQAAVLTVRIHNINSHIQQHRKDVHNYKQLRTMIHQRAKILKYLAGKSRSRYNLCLQQLGLSPRAVEGEIII
ncbi:hypothetical protein BDF14DRAFT_885749 [Spinellus fusiger]|nr:hypothetical protein BDF14DRAFT_885749 [Spinellus fusiger]